MINKEIYHHDKAGIEMRQTFKLSDIEQRQFRRLRPFQNEAVSFWKKVADMRGVDAASIISQAPIFTALPLGHGKHWCFPHALKCKKKPVYED